ncbi:MAG: META domain-containing protein [Vicinamibacterales bacterium]|nr:META domain-containing protein [Vicinamibacterales bacterium]
MFTMTKDRCRLALPVFAMAAFLAGCDIFLPSDLTNAQVAGEWTLESIQPSGQSAQTVPGGATYTLTLADGNLSTRADCNTCAGRYTLAGKTLTAGPTLACTRAACPTVAFENAYTSILSGESTVAASPTGLTLTSARGTLRYTR